MSKEEKTTHAPHKCSGNCSNCPRKNKSEEKSQEKIESTK